MNFFANDDSRMSHVVSTLLTQEPIKPIQISTLEESTEPVASTSSSANLQDDTCLAATSRRLLQLPEQEDTPRTKKLKAALRKKTEAVTNLRKKIRAVRQTNRRLIKRNAQLTNIISKLKLKSLISYEDADILSTIDAGNKDF